MPPNRSRSHVCAAFTLRSEFIVTDAMREQSLRNMVDSETLGLQQEAFFTQKQLALHAQRDRAEERRDYNEGLAEGASGMAEMADLAEDGAWAADGDAFGAMAAAAALHAAQATERMRGLRAIADELPSS